MSLARFLRRKRWDRERVAEIDSYEQLETDENIARGMPPADARAAARRKFGNQTLVREEIYRMNTIAMLDSLVREIRFGIRMLRRNPGFTIVALLTLAIGIGANSAVFSVVNSVLLHPLPYPNSGDLVSVRQAAPGAAGLATITDGLRLSPSMYYTYSENNRTLQSFGVWIAGTGTVTGLAEPEEVKIIFVSDGALQALAVPPMLGRSLGPIDQQPGSPETVLLSYGYWQRRFGGDRSVVGRAIRVDGRPREVIGVMPQGFRFVDVAADLILPLRFVRNQLILAGFGYQGVARLRPGVTIPQANADLARLVPVWMDSWSNGPGTSGHVYESWRITPALRPLKQDVVGSVDSILWVVMGTIGIVLLIACANVANLMLVRADARQQELALRAALGAGWGRIVRGLLLESVSLGLAGGALGLALAWAGLRLLVAVGPAQIPRLAEISIDVWSLLFILAVSLLAGLFLGLLPAFKYAGPRISLTLRSGGRTLSQGRERLRTRNILVVAQVAMALVLLVAAGLMIRTFLALHTVAPGFTEPGRLQTVRISIPPSLIPETDRVVRTQQEIARKLATIPGVDSASFGSAMPMEGFETWWDEVIVKGRPSPNNEIAPMRMFQFVSPGFFQTAGTRFIAGRDFTWTDPLEMRPVVIMSENLAREFWGSPAAAIGKQVRTGKNWREVIGVVADLRYNGVDKPAPAIVYWPCKTRIYEEAGDIVSRAATFVIRSGRTGTQGFREQVQQAVWSVNPNLALASVRTMQDIYGESLARASFTLVMLGIAGAMALVLGVIGIYGVLSYAVSQRRREIGIRLALGAPPAQLRQMFVRFGLTLSCLGVVIGLVAAAGLSRLMSSLLFGIKPVDPATYGAVAGILVIAAILASYLPARRAASVDPVDTLRAE